MANFRKFRDQPLGEGAVPSAPSGRVAIDAATCFAMGVDIVQEFDLERLPDTASLVVRLLDMSATLPGPEVVIAGPVDLAELARGGDDGIARIHFDLDPCYAMNVFLAWTLDDHIDPDGQSALGAGVYAANCLIWADNGV